MLAIVLRQEHEQNTQNGNVDPHHADENVLAVLQLFFEDVCAFVLLNRNGTFLRNLASGHCLLQTSVLRASKGQARVVLDGISVNFRQAASHAMVHRIFLVDRHELLTVHLKLVDKIGDLFRLLICGKLCRHGIRQKWGLLLRGHLLLKVNGYESDGLSEERIKHAVEHDRRIVYTSWLRSVRKKNPIQQRIPKRLWDLLFRGAKPLDLIGASLLNVMIRNVRMGP
jgi:hypothetical protein